MPRKATPLTDSAIKVAKPKDKPYKLTDGQGLYLEVMPTGSKLWRLKYRHSGKEKRLALGAYPAVPLQNARKKRDEARELLSEGTDPGEQKKAAKVAQKVEGLTFETLAREWYDYTAPRWADATAYKAKLPFIDVNQEREHAFAGYDGMVELARQICLTLESPIWSQARSRAPWQQTISG